jgi:hypothetical protein
LTLFVTFIIFEAALIGGLGYAAYRFVKKGFFPGLSSKRINQEYQILQQNTSLTEVDLVPFNIKETGLVSLNKMAPKSRKLRKRHTYIVNSIYHEAYMLVSGRYFSFPYKLNLTLIKTGGPEFYYVEKKDEVMVFLNGEALGIIDRNFTLTHVKTGKVVGKIDFKPDAEYVAIYAGLREVGMVFNKLHEINHYSRAFHLSSNINEDELLAIAALSLYYLFAEKSIFNDKLTSKKDNKEED